MNFSEPGSDVVSLRRNIPGIVLALLLSAAVAPSRAAGQSVTITACIPNSLNNGKPGSGVVYRINKPAGSAPTAPLSCAAGDIEFTWNQLGPIGPTGPTGAVGAPGPGGPTGAAGPAGAQGPTGPMGSAGADGAAGAQGPIGPAGPQGAVGAAGAQGSVGPQGAVGPQGPVGPQGTSGVLGFEMVYNTAYINASPDGQGVTSAGGIACPAGKRAFGGGFRVNMAAAFMKEVQVVMSRPLDQAAGWFVLVNMYGAQQGYMEIWASCIIAP